MTSGTPRPLTKNYTEENMAVCPRCWDNLVDTKNKLEQRCVNEYGKIPKEEYMALVEESRIAIEGEHSLQERYEIGLEKNGKFAIGYKCTCLSCGYFYNFEHTEQAIGLA